MKSILLSVRPKWVEKILNGKKTIEVRKQFPEDYVGWVYIYCTKGKPSIYYVDDEVGCVEKINGEFAFRTRTNPPALNGKVVARFYCDKVEELYTDENGMSYYTDTIKEDYMVSKLACLDDSDIENYLGGKIGYAIHISQLEIFDKPKELSEFGYYESDETMPHRQVLKAAQNYCYIESEKGLEK